MGYTLQVTGVGTSALTTTPIRVTALQATQLVVTTQPSGVVAGAGFGLTVSGEDQYGNVDPTFTGTVTLSKATGPSGSNLGGATGIQAVNGVAVFSTLTLDTVGANYTLLATGTSGVSSTTTWSFSVNQAIHATQLVVTAQPPTAVAAGQSFGLTVSAEDSSGRLDSTFTGDVSVALANNPSGGNLGGTIIVQAVNGVATFAGLSLNKVGVGYTIQAICGGLTSATTGPIGVVPRGHQPGNHLPTLWHRHRRPSIRADRLGRGSLGEHRFHVHRQRDRRAAEQPRRERPRRYDHGPGGQRRRQLHGTGDRHGWHRFPRPLGGVIYGSRLEPDHDRGGSGHTTRRDLRSHRPRPSMPPPASASA